MHALTRNKLLLATFVMSLLYAFHYGIPLYVTSTYLHTYFSGGMVSALYVIASVVTILASIHLAQYIRRFHTYTFTMGLIISEIIITIAFGATSNPILLGLFFVAHFCTQALLLICLNIFVETFTKHTETGSIRGLFLMLFNLGILTSPIIGGLILSRGSFTALYTVAAAILLPCLFFMHHYMNHVQEPAYHTVDMLGALKRAWKNTDLRGALIAAMMLECFYAVMVIYSPLYLQSLGISLTIYLTMILPFVLLPLVVLPYELGLLADIKYGEKELLLMGMLVIALSLFAIVILDTTNIFVWIAVLLLSRIGAALVETMTYTYYYKKIDAKDVSLTALFGNIRSIATVTIGTAGFFLAPLLTPYPQLMFIVMGIAALLAIVYVMPIHDTR